MRAAAATRHSPAATQNADFSILRRWASDFISKAVTRRQRNERFLREAYFRR